MARKKIDGKTVVHRRQYSIGDVIGLTLFGCGFSAIGIGLLVMEIKILMEVLRGETPFGAQYIFMSLLVLGFLGGGIGALVWGWKGVYHWRKKRLARKYGDDGFAIIVNSHWHSEGKNDDSFHLTFVRYGFDLVYKKDGEVKTFKTDEVYDVNEYEYLKSLDKVKIKIYKNYVAIDEDFLYEIYKKDSVHGVDKKYFTEKPFSTIYKAMMISTIIAVVAFIALFALTIILHNNLFVFIGIGLIFLGIFPFGMAYLYYYFKDKKKK